MEELEKIEVLKAVDNRIQALTRLNSFNIQIILWNIGLLVIYGISKDNFGVSLCFIYFMLSIITTAVNTINGIYFLQGVLEDIQSKNLKEFSDLVLEITLKSKMNLTKKIILSIQIIGLLILIYNTIYLIGV